VEVLLGRDDVDHLVKVVLVEALCGTGNVARDVDARAVLLAHDRLLKLVLLEVDDERALALLNDARPLELLERVLLCLLRHLRLARVDVEPDVEARVRLLVLDDRQVPELLPQPDRVLIAYKGEVQVSASHEAFQPSASLTNRTHRPPS